MSEEDDTVSSAQVRELNKLLGNSSEESSLECEESDMGFGKTPHSGSSIVNAALTKIPNVEFIGYCAAANAWHCIYGPVELYFRNYSHYIRL